MPVFPFFLINLAMGLTKLPARAFWWVSQLGMLPGTLVYVNAGRELGQLESLGGILSPGLLGAFALLGVFPLLARKLRCVRHHRVLAASPTPLAARGCPALPCHRANKHTHTRTHTHIINDRVLIINY